MLRDLFSFNIIRGSLLRFGLILCEKKNLDIFILNVTSKCMDYFVTCVTNTRLFSKSESLKNIEGINPSVYIGDWKRVQCPDM